ncbi:MULTISPECIES: hypothetical protein [unclassified Synechocystis]|uniref:hypothetical protein n=1 Tax=unclassified Synechocystis TaxID=2640012 RepID=UPI00048F4FE4|nr:MULTISPECIES: hypothetical protein [unclassified Synechocystis]MCT0254215.1 hypothetical protein [Synechocystis sp. CS-94]
MTLSSNIHTMPDPGSTVAISPYKLTLAYEGNQIILTLDLVIPQEKILENNVNDSLATPLQIVNQYQNYVLS